MAKLPAYGRELRQARLAGLAPEPHPWRRARAPGFLLVSDSWAVAGYLRALGRSVVVVEPSVPYAWDFVLGLEVWVAVRFPARELAAAIALGRPADLLIGGPGEAGLGAWLEAAVADLRAEGRAA